MSEPRTSDEAEETEGAEEAEEEDGSSSSEEDDEDEEEEEEIYKGKDWWRKLSYKDFFDHVVLEWEERQNVSCTNPYVVLGAHVSDADEDLDNLLQRKIGKYLEEGHTDEGVARLMVVRARRAHSCLTDKARRVAQDTMLKHAINTNTYSKLFFANGFYEGHVDQLSMAKGSTPSPSGMGVMVLTNGEKYEGEHSEGKKEGIGLQFWANGDLYLGQWWSDKMSGRGYYMYGTGVSYCGDFVGGRRHGHGRQHWVDGSEYVGQFVQGSRSGQGVLLLPMEDGKRKGEYDGQWRDNAMHGRGVYKSNKEGNYEGQFKANAFDGQGRLELPSGDVHIGTFARGRRDGKGRYEWANGDWFEGMFRNNCRDGAGVFVSKERGMRLQGEFQNDMPHGHCTMIQEIEAGMCEYEGQWERGTKDGSGTFVWPDGCKYKGQFIQDKKDGSGMLRWNDGSKFKGAFAHDIRDGSGVFKSSKGQEQIETWQNGDLVKEHVVEGDASLPPSAAGSAPPTADRSQKDDSDSDGGL